MIAGFAKLEVDPFGSISVSLTINGVGFTDSTSASLNGNHVFIVKNSVLNFKDLSFRDINIAGSLVYSQNASGSLENVSLKSVSVSVLPAFQLLDPLWSFINVTFDGVRPTSSSNGIIYLASTLSGRNNQVTFGGNITFLNVPTSTAWNSGATAISIIHTTAATPILIGSSSTKPSQFVMRNSDMSLFSSRGKMSSASLVNITVGSSIDVIATPSSAYQRAIFNLESQDVVNRYGVTNVHVQGSIYAQGISILARGAGASSTPIASAKAQLKVDGNITLSADGSAPAPFRLVWPADIFAAGIASQLIGRSSDAMITPFVAFKSGVFTSSASPSVSTWTVANDFSISSVPVNASTPSYTSTSIIPLTLPNIGISIVSGSFSINNALTSSSTASYSNTRLAAAISLSDGGSLSIATTNGNLTFEGNQNLFGAGGAIYMDATAKLTLKSDSHLIFSNNTAYFGGALYQQAGSTLQVSATSILFEGNVATQAGGVALISKTNLTANFPENITTFEDNGAFVFGCIFAFTESAPASDASNTSCPALYNATSVNGNHRLSESYVLAETCQEFERLCDPIIEPVAPVTPPIADPIAEPTLEPLESNSTDPTSSPTDEPLATPAEGSSPSNADPTFYRPSDNATGPVILIEPATGNGSNVCRNGSHVPPQAYCDGGVWKMSATDAVAYFSTSKRSAEDTDPICDVPIEIVGGNATIPSVALANVFISTSSVPMLYSSDCIIVDKATFELSMEELKRLICAKRAMSVFLINSSCSSRSTSVRLTGAEPVYGCQRIESEGDASNLKLSIDDSRCNIWWIVLLAVLGAIFLAAAIIALVYNLCWSKRRSQTTYIRG